MPPAPGLPKRNYTIQLLAMLMFLLWVTDEFLGSQIYAIEGLLFVVAGVAMYISYATSACRLLGGRNYLVALVALLTYTTRSVVSARPTVSSTCFRV
jgi:hypothetical protein